MILGTALFTIGKIDYFWLQKNTNYGKYNNYNKKQWLNESRRRL